MEIFTRTQATGDQFGDQFWRASRRLGDEVGPRLVYAVVVCCRSFQDEMGLIFVPLVVQLPRKAAVKILKSYEHVTRESDRV